VAPEQTLSVEIALCAWFADAHTRNVMPILHKRFVRKNAGALLEHKHARDLGVVAVVKSVVFLGK
jgi:hypothetical protein